MMRIPNMSEYIRQLAWQVKWQQEKLNGLNEKMKEMEKAIDELKNRSFVRVDRIEYHFDQLKVEKLEGALHIGIMPDAGKSIEELVVNQQEVGLKPAQEQPHADVRADIDAYLKNELPQAIESLEAECRFPLGADYRQMIVDDIERQVDERIRHYLEHDSDAADGSSDAQQWDIRKRIVEKVKRDIRSAVDRHFRMLPREGGGANEAGSGQ